MLLDFLKAFTSLSRSEQKVFIFCVQFCPHPRKYTGDLQRIIAGTGLARLTVYRALQKISASPTLRKTVCYIREDIKTLLLIEQETSGMDEGS